MAEGLKIWEGEYVSKYAPFSWDTVNCSANIWGRGHRVLKWGFTWTLGIKMQHWNKCAHFYKILFVFEVPNQPRVKGMSAKS